MCKSKRRDRAEKWRSYFPYGRTEVDYLKGRDKILAAVIDKIGHVDREVDTDLFSSVVHHIIGQQISTRAQATIWARMKAQFGEVNRFV